MPIADHHNGALRAARSDKTKRPTRRCALAPHCSRPARSVSGARCFCYTHPLMQQKRQTRDISNTRRQRRRNLGRRENKISDSLRQAAQRELSLTTAEAAAMTGYDRDHISLMIRRRRLKGARRGRDWFVDAASLLTYVMGDPRPGR